MAFSAADEEERADTRIMCNTLMRYSPQGFEQLLSKYSDIEDLNRNNN